MQMSQSKKNMKYVPYNHRYMENGILHYGKAESTGEDCVRLVDVDKHQICIWQRRGYCNYQLHSSENVEDGWETIGKRRKLVESRKITPCPHELHNKGECPMRFTPEHQKWHYHFSMRLGKEVIRDTDGKPVCRYRLFGHKKCWESQNGEHRKVFAHK